MCVQNICEHCETYLDGTRNLELCYLMEQMSATGEGLVCPNLELTKQDPLVEICYFCNMNQDAVHVGFDAPRPFAGAVSERDAAPNQAPDISKQQENAWAYPSSLCNDDGNLSYSSAGQPRRLLPSQSGITVQRRAPRPCTTPRNVSQQPLQIRSDSKMGIPMDHVVAPEYKYPSSSTEDHFSPYFAPTNDAPRPGWVSTGLLAFGKHSQYINSGRDEAPQLNPGKQGHMRSVAKPPGQQASYEHRRNSSSDGSLAAAGQPQWERLPQRKSLRAYSNAAPGLYGFPNGGVGGPRNSASSEAGTSRNLISPAYGLSGFYGDTFKSGSHSPAMFGHKPSTSGYASLPSFNAPRPYGSQPTLTSPSTKSSFSAIQGPLLSPNDASLMNLDDSIDGNILNEQNLMEIGGQHSNIEGRIQHQSSQRNPSSRKPTTKPARKGKRAGKACSNCRERKVKCDEGTPTCGPCLAKGRTGCDYGWEPKYGRLGKPKRTPKPKRSTRNTGPEQQPQIRPTAARLVMPSVEADSVVGFWADEVDFHGASEPEDREAEVALALAKWF